MSADFVIHGKRKPVRPVGQIILSIFGQLEEWKFTGSKKIAKVGSTFYQILVKTVKNVASGC